MEDQTNEARDKECLWCKGKGELFGVLTDGSFSRGIKECIACEGTGKVTEAKHIKDLKWCRDFARDPELKKAWTSASRGNTGTRYRERGN